MQFPLINAFKSGGEFAYAIGTASAGSGLVAGAIGSLAANAGAMGSSAVGRTAIGANGSP